jgi:hypothetical protein
MVPLQRNRGEIVYDAKVVLLPKYGIIKIETIFYKIDPRFLCSGTVWFAKHYFLVVLGSRLWPLIYFLLYMFIHKKQVYTLFTGYGPRVTNSQRCRRYYLSPRS